MLIRLIDHWILQERFKTIELIVTWVQKIYFKKYGMPIVGTLTNGQTQLSLVGIWFMKYKSSAFGIHEKGITVRFPENILQLTHCTNQWIQWTILGFPCWCTIKELVQLSETGVTFDVRNRNCACCRAWTRIDSNWATIAWIPIPTYEYLVLPFGVEPVKYEILGTKQWP